jgi:hypothetical protein
MVSKYQSIFKNNTWELVSLLPGIRPITAHWVFKLKSDINGVDALYKARIVACGNKQSHGVNFQETFVPTIFWESIHLIVALAAHHG